MSETDWQAQVVGYARLKGWRVAHFRQARTAGGGWVTPVSADGAGFPDLFMVRGQRCLAVELKSARGRVAVGQQAWLDALTAAHVETEIWRPADWPMVEAILR